jgi:hypothetical protein
MYNYRIMLSGGGQMAGRYDTGPAASVGVDPVIGQAADLLGWQGEIVPDVTLLGTVTSMVVTFDRQAHARRQEDGTAQPVLDADTLAMWEWPQAEGTFPPSVISMVGVLAHHEQAVKTLVGTARKWRGFAASAILLPARKPFSHQQQLECSYLGIAVLRHARKHLEALDPGHPERLSTARRSVADRWVEEHLYGMLLARFESADALLPGHGR